MLPVVHPEAKFTFMQITAFSFLLVAFSLMPSLMGMSGRIYFWGALALGAGILYTAFLFQKSQSNPGCAQDIGRIDRLSYRLLLILIIVDGIFYI